MLVNLWQSVYTKRRQEVTSLIGPSAAQLAIKVYLQFQVGAIAGILALVTGKWLERGGPVLLWAPMGIAIAIFCGLFVPEAITVKRMNRVASAFVSSAVGYPITITPNQFVLRRISWERAIERGKQIHERTLAGKPQRRYL